MGILRNFSWNKKSEQVLNKKILHKTINSIQEISQSLEPKSSPIYTRSCLYVVWSDFGSFLHTWNLSCLPSFIFIKSLIHSVIPQLIHSKSSFTLSYFGADFSGRSHIIIRWEKCPFSHRKKTFFFISSNVLLRKA